MAAKSSPTTPERVRAVCGPPGEGQGGHDNKKACCGGRPGRGFPLFCTVHFLRHRDFVEGHSCHVVFWDSLWGLPCCSASRVAGAAAAAPPSKGRCCPTDNLWRELRSSLKAKRKALRTVTSPGPTTPGTLKSSPSGRTASSRGPTRS